jgi:hypothetical protein
MIEKLDNESIGTYRVKTWSGSEYYFILGKNKYLKRVNKNHSLREDGNYIEIFNIINLHVDEEAELILEPLGHALFEGDSIFFTVRKTTKVIEITKIEEIWILNKK